MTITTLSQRESSDTAFAAEFRAFWKPQAAFVAELGHLAFGRLRRCHVPGRVLVETADHVVGAASMVRIFAI